jgi:hypothetical protein
MFSLQRVTRNHDKETSREHGRGLRGKLKEIKRNNPILNRPHIAPLLNWHAAGPDQLL